MAELKLQVPDDLLVELKSVWEFNQRHMRPDVLQRIGWQELEAFVADVLAHGYREASQSPMEFLKRVRDHKDPLFAMPPDEGKGTDGDDDEEPHEEFHRAYS